MATMLKQKRKEKKKSRNDPLTRITDKSDQQTDQPTITEKSDINLSEAVKSLHKNTENFIQNVVSNTQDSDVANIATTSISKSVVETNSLKLAINAQVDPGSSKEAFEELKTENDLTNPINEGLQVNMNVAKVKTQIIKQTVGASNISNAYKSLSYKLERMCIPNLDTDISIEEIQNRLENPLAYLRKDELKRIKLDSENEMANISAEFEQISEDFEPSAPVFEEDTITAIDADATQTGVQEVRSKTQCVPLEEAIKLFGGREIAEVRAMSEREEAVVEAGPVSGSEHPLVDLLSTFRTSLRAVEKERLQLAQAFSDEAKFRNALWKVEQRTVSLSAKCSCGTDVHHTTVFETATFLKVKLSIAKLKLESLLRDVQDSYCHHQNAALLAYCQIEELVSETIKSNKNEIREALALILQALRLSDSAPAIYAAALQRWASALSAALLDGRDIRQLLYLLHHLFRQTRSVRWAAKLIHMSAGDRSAAAQVIAVLELLLMWQRSETAMECTEDSGWEEVDVRGGGCAVSEGSLREHDLLAVLNALPLRDLVARIVLFTHSDIRNAREYEWYDGGKGQGVIRACAGARTLLAVLEGGVASHPHYKRLHQELRMLAANALHALAGLHLHTKHTYSPELTDKVHAELEAAFTAGFNLYGATDLQHLPATLLADDTVKEYCIAYMVDLHGKTSKPLETLSIALPVLTCDARLAIVTQAAVDRAYDHELARMMMDYLFQIGIKKSSVTCKRACDSVARKQLQLLLAAHPYLHTVAFHTLADLHQVEPIDHSTVAAVSPESWRPTPTEMKSLLDDWTQRCPAFLEHLLLKFEYTPHVGLLLETQLVLGDWLCAYARQVQHPEWCWRVLMKLNVHRVGWTTTLDVPPPNDTSDLFALAYALLSSSWGHCVPLICSQGVSALCHLSSRAAIAVHCFELVMLVMAHSPESISHTPKFGEFISLLLKSGPTMVQRALGLGPVPGSELLTRLILKQLENKHPIVPISSIQSAWLHALWPVTGASSLLETALLAARDWTLFDSHAAALVQDKKSSEFVSNAVRNSHVAPLACECLLRAKVHMESGSVAGARLLHALHCQRAKGDKIHVDNALKQVGASMSSEELVIYRCAAALLLAPTQHPSHLMLWRLFFHLYLQRPTISSVDIPPPVGPLFFSGLIKSRLLAQLRKKLQETITYHQSESEKLKQFKEVEVQSPPRRKKEESTTPVEKEIVPILTIEDLTEESNKTDDEQEEIEVKEQNDKEQSKKNREDLIKYHGCAEVMFKELLRWFDEGETTRAMPHHVDIARFIPEQALKAAWELELSRRRPPKLEESSSSSCSEINVAGDTSPFQATISRLLKIEHTSDIRSNQVTIKSLLDGVDLRNSRTIEALADKQMEEIEKLGKEWSSEVSRISSLDSALWQYVTALWEHHHHPPVRKQCPQKCSTVTIHFPHTVWSLSAGAERSLLDNRRTAAQYIWRLARARPQAARSAATLTALVRYIRSPIEARRIVDRAWRCAGTMDNFTLAHSALTALVQLLVDRWIAVDGKLCVEVLSRWCSRPMSGLQHTVCGSVVRPQEHHWLQCYLLLLKGSLPAHAAFSYLSKFEMNRWSKSADPSQRAELLEALCEAVQRWGPQPDAEYHVLLELLGVHTSALLNANEVCAHISRCARASVVCSMPYTLWTHLVRALNNYGKQVPFDQLGHSLRDLGAIWWEARSKVNANNIAHYAQYSAHIAAILQALERVFVAAAQDLSYAPERVALYAWSSIQESWGPWVAPHSLPPLLPSAGDSGVEPYTPMLKRFIDNLHQVMLDSPGSEEHLLHHVFEWTVQTYLGTRSVTVQECHIQMSALLVELRSLPWIEHQWIRRQDLQTALQVCGSKDREIQSWCADAWRGTIADSWLIGADCQQLAPMMASLLYLFTCMPQHDEVLQQAGLLPWYRLPEPALEEALDRFFAQYHNPTQPYHVLPQFTALLYASELAVNVLNPGQANSSELSRSKRGTAISRWLRAATVPTLVQHVAGYSSAVLNVLTDLAPHLDGSKGELEELLCRAVNIMCIEPAAAAALPVWQRWVRTSDLRISCACVSGVGALTAFEYYAALGDDAVLTVMLHKDSPGWSDISKRWKDSHWNEPSPLIARCRLHAAYAVSVTHQQTYESLRIAALTLMATNINFIEQEVIVAVWICSICRMCKCVGAGGGGAEGEVRAAGGAVLARWGEDVRRSLIKMVTLQQDAATPTDKHRLLARLAQCIVSPTDATVRSYESLCSTVLSSIPDVQTWARTPKPKSLPRLAMRLYPNHDKYFHYELEMTPEL